MIKQRWPKDQTIESLMQIRLKPLLLNQAKGRPSIIQALFTISVLSTIAENLDWMYIFSSGNVTARHRSRSLDVLEELHLTEHIYKAVDEALAGQVSWFRGSKLTDNEMVIRLTKIVDDHLLPHEMVTGEQNTYFSDASLSPDIGIIASSLQGTSI